MKRYQRILQLPGNQSIFLFGARNTGKSTLVKEVYDDSSLILDLLKKSTEFRFMRNPDELFDIVMGLSEKTTHIIIDEIQKVPALLDVVHRLMGETDKIFVMTGSSARKLKQGGANLLAGRAFVYYLYPLTHVELGDAFDIGERCHNFLHLIMTK